MAAVPQLGRAAGVEPRVAPGAAATEELYERYSRQIYSFCLHQLGNREEAEDAVQTTFLNAFRGLSRGISPEAESAWLFKIAHNVCLTRRRSSYRRGRVETPGDMQALQDFVAAPQRMGADELIELQEALAGMPSNQRKAILLREWRGLSYHEIAEEMEISQAAVETLIFRARRSLAQGLEQSVPERRKLLKRLRHGLDVGTLVATIKTLLAGSAAAKAVATAAAVSATVGVVASVPSEERVPRRGPVERPAVVAPKTEQAKPAPQTLRRSDVPSVGITAVRLERKPSPKLTVPVRPTRAKPPTRAAVAPTQQAVTLPVEAPPAPAEAPPVSEPQAAQPAPQPEQHASPPAHEERPKVEQPREERKSEERTSEKKNEPRREEAKAETPRPVPTRETSSAAPAEPKVEEPKSEKRKEDVRKYEDRKGDSPGQAKKDEKNEPVTTPVAAEVVTPEAPVQAPAVEAPTQTNEPRGHSKKDEQPAAEPAPAGDESKGDSKRERGNGKDKSGKG